MPRSRADVSAGGRAADQRRRRQLPEVEAAGRGAGVALVVLVGPGGRAELGAAVQELGALDAGDAGARQPVAAGRDQLEQLVRPASELCRPQALPLRDEPAAWHPMVTLVQLLGEQA